MITATRRHRMATAPPRFLRLQRLPRTSAPLLNETVNSYIWRLAHANAINGDDLRLHLTGSVRNAHITVDDLAVITGYPVQSLRYAMLELCTEADLAGMRITGRPRPGAEDRSRPWPYNRRRHACQHCAAQSGITHGAYVWATHEDVVCLRHRRWIGSPDDADQPDLTGHPDILRANRKHRHLIRRYGRDSVRNAIVDATDITRQWNTPFWSTAAASERRDLLERRGVTTVSTSAAATDAALYPETVALARLFASPYWHHQALADNLNPEPFDQTILTTIHREIDAGIRHPDDIPEDIRVAAAGRLRQGPALARFINEIQQTVEPRYRWDPWSRHRKYPPITQWIMDEIEAIRDPDDFRRRHRRRRRELSPEQFSGIA